MQLFGTIRDFSLFKLNFHRLDHVCKVLYRFSNLAALDTSVYEPFNFIFEKFVRMTLINKATTNEKTVKVINGSASSPEFSKCSQTVSHAAGLARDGVRISLDSCIASSLPCLARLSKDEKSRSRTCFSRT